MFFIGLEEVTASALDMTHSSENATYPDRLVPSGKRTKKYGKSSFLMGKSTIYITIFNSYVT